MSPELPHPVIEWFFAVVERRMANLRLIPPKGHNDHEQKTQIGGHQPPEDYVEHAASLRHPQSVKAA